MAISAIDSAAFVLQFKDSVKELAGGPMRSYLKESISKETCTGVTSYIGGAFQPNLTAGATTALASRTNRYTFDQSGSTSAAAFASAVLTRNDTGVFQRTQIQAKEIEVGMWKDFAEKEFLALADVSSKELRNFMQGYFTKQDLLVIESLFSATTTRVVGNAATPTTTSSVAMPAGQILPDYTLANIDYKVFGAIRKRFMKQYIAGKKIYACFDPETWEAIVINSGDKMISRDFVADASCFTTGELPTCFGVVPMVHPLFGNATLLGDTLGEGEAALMAAWTEDGMCWGEYKAQETLMELNIAAMKGQSVASVREFGNSARIDDLQVVIGSVTEQ